MSDLPLDPSSTKPSERRERERPRGFRERLIEHKQRHGWHPGPRPVNRLQCYIRARLHRRIFIWFGTAILLAALTAFGMMTLLGGSQWQRDFDGVRAFAARRFSESWDDPPARQALANEIHRDLSVNVTMRDPAGAVVGQAGPSCGLRPTFKLPILKGGDAVGSVDVCSTQVFQRHFAAFASILAACFALWLISAIISRKITGSLHELERAAIEIGHGRYEPEIRLSHKAPGEFLLLGEALRDMGAKIKAQMAEQRELLASVSHEIRSPLARIRLLLELSRPSTPPGDEDGESARAEWAAREKAIGDMEREIEEIDELVGGLLANSRVDFSALSRRPLDLEEACGRAVERAGAQAKIIVSGEKRLAELDATLFARAMANLVENAATHGQGADRVEIAFNGEAVRVDVLDRGPGLLPGEEGKIFQSFYRRPTKTHESLGLGLALVRKIAEAHGGSASARNRDGGGAIIGFEVPLPRAAEDFV